MTRDRLKEGYHPTCWEQVRIFLGGFWKPHKVKGMIRGIRYVNEDHGLLPGSKFFNGVVTTLQSESVPLSTFFQKGRLMLLNFGSWT